MIDDEDHAGQGEAAATAGNKDSAEDIQKAQEQAGIAGEPQPTDVEADDDPEEPTSSPGYDGA